MEALKYNVWDIQNINKEFDDDSKITDDLLKKNGFKKDNTYNDRLIIFKESRSLRCDILWVNLNLKTVKDLRDLKEKLFKNVRRT